MVRWLLQSIIATTFHNLILQLLTSSLFLISCHQHVHVGATSKCHAVPEHSTQIQLKSVMIGDSFFVAAVYVMLITTSRYVIMFTSSCLHHLAQGMIAVEGMNLEALTAGVHQLHCLPVKLKGSDGAPVRCITIA